MFYLLPALHFEILRAPWQQAVEMVSSLLPLTDVTSSALSAGVSIGTYATARRPTFPGHQHSKRGKGRVPRAQEVAPALQNLCCMSQILLWGPPCGRCNRKIGACISLRQCRNRWNMPIKQSHLRCGWCQVMNDAPIWLERRLKPSQNLKELCSRFILYNVCTIH